MTTTTRTPSAQSVSRAAVPPLQNGDHLTRAEFERRYDATPDVKKAELLEGVVYMAPAVSYRDHGNPHFNVIVWLGQYCLSTRHIRGADNASLRLDLDSEPQPDVFLIIAPEAGGQARVDEDGYIVGGPELIVEIAASSASYDLHTKLNVYRRNGVREYVVWRVFDEAIDWFVLREERYERLAMKDGRYQSEALPGLWLDPAALMRGDLPGVAQVVAEGAATPEHQAFAARLAATAGH